jgi:hypothetical protein
VQNCATFRNLGRLYEIAGAMRLVLVDRNSDRICGDTAMFAARSAEWAENSFRSIDVEHMSLIAARLLDESEGKRCWVYEFICFRPLDTTGGYDIFLVDEEMAEGVPEFFNAQDDAAMSTLITLCQYVGHVSCAPPVLPMKAKRRIEKALADRLPCPQTGVRHSGTR